ncbi:tRNA(Met) cytidine acetyltransferase TmcA [Natronorarus salvus]|uniref:tRNA(Met) cytidine acetyltransferase TmcA n=1 Tax=Natronorarus salvus TaxID=3117733 RepID=UPI002F26C84A
MDPGSVAAALLAEARTLNERRLLVLSGDRDRCESALREVVSAVEVPRSKTTLVSDRSILACERVDPVRTAELLGRTRTVVVYDAHDVCIPNALGRVTGAVDGGGLLVLLTPSLDAWPDRRDGFDEGLAVPPFEAEEVGSRFRTRLVETLRAHRGVATVDVDAARVESDGLTGAHPRATCEVVRPPESRRFPEAAYGACLTADQAAAVEAFEDLIEGGRALVVESDRGRGKSSAAGIAAGALAAEGETVVVTAPAPRNADEVFARARALLSELGALSAGAERDLESDEGGSVRFVAATEAVAAEPDVLIVDEAAALPVSLLTGYLSVPRVAFATTIHGYEGAGRGFSVRFRGRLDEAAHELREVRLDTPIRYAPGDPVEVWSFHALALDARPAVEGVVSGAGPENVRYERLDPERLMGDERLLSEAFGLLVSAHYRTEPDDLARLLDAPNLSVRALTWEGHVVSVALLAREGGLDADRRERLSGGERIRGNMIPDLLTSQLRDPDAGAPVGVRIVRVATHHAVRSRGLGSHLLGRIEAEVGPDVDWLGTGFGATPALLSFWHGNGYRSVHLSTTRNDASGEHSVVLLRPTDEAGRALSEYHGTWFADRIEGMLTDALREVDPDVVRVVLRATEAETTPSLCDRDRRLVESAAAGFATLEVDPSPFRRLALTHLLDPTDGAITAREERVLVSRVLQAHSWEEVADREGYVSARMCMRAFGETIGRLLDRHDATATAPGGEASR